MRTVGRGSWQSGAADVASSSVASLDAVVPISLPIPFVAVWSASVSYPATAAAATYSGCGYHDNQHFRLLSLLQTQRTIRRDPQPPHPTRCLPCQPSVPPNTLQLPDHTTAVKKAGPQRRRGESRSLVANRDSPRSDGRSHGRTCNSERDIVSSSVVSPIAGAGATAPSC